MTPASGAIWPPQLQLCDLLSATTEFTNCSLPKPNVHRMLYDCFWPKPNVCRKCQFVHVQHRNWSRNLVNLYNCERSAGSKRPPHNTLLMSTDHSNTVFKLVSWFHRLWILELLGNYKMRSAKMRKCEIEPRIVRNKMRTKLRILYVTKHKVRNWKNAKCD